MSITGAVFTFCSIDNKLIEDSLAYKLIKAWQGAEAADALTFEQHVNFNDDEVREVVEGILNNHPMGGAAS